MAEEEWARWPTGLQTKEHMALVNAHLKAYEQKMTIHLPSLRRRQLRRNAMLMRNQTTWHVWPS
jgi:hypothetical protein